MEYLGYKDKKNSLIENAMLPRGVPYRRITKRVRIFLSLNPPKFVEGTIFIPGPKARLSDVANDDRIFLSVQDVVAPEGWIPSLSKFVLLNKNEIKAMTEVEGFK